MENNKKEVTPVITTSELEKATIKEYYDKWSSFLVNIILLLGYGYLETFSLSNIFVRRNADLLIDLKNSNIQTIFNVSQYAIVVFLILFRGLTLSIDSKLSSLLKTPFSQMSYYINTNKKIDKQQKERIVGYVTEVMEHCKEVLKKFSIVTLSQMPSSLLRGILMLVAKEKKDKKYDLIAGILIQFNWLWDISLLIPLMYTLSKLGESKREIHELKMRDE